MDTEDHPIFTGGLRHSDDGAIDESGVLGTRRSWKNINRYEIIFLIVGVIAAIATDSLTAFRFANIPKISDPDFVYGIVILFNSVFLLLFLITGIFQQRITDIVTFFISSVMLTIYIVAHYIIRQKQTHDTHSTEAIIRLARLICTIVFNVCFIPLTIFVIQDYRRDEYSKRLFGAFPTARWPLKMYNIFDCLARVDTMLSLSLFLLNLYNFNYFEYYDEVFLGVGVPLSLLWLGVGVGMIRLENRILVGIFYLLSLFQPGFLVYCLYSAIKYPSSKTTTTSTFPPSTTTFSSSVASTLTTTTGTFSSSTTTSPNIVPVSDALFVCIGINLLTHILSMVVAYVCIRNFGKGLKERVFNNRADKWLQKRWSKS